MFSTFMTAVADILEYRTWSFWCLLEYERQPFCITIKSSNSIGLLRELIRQKCKTNSTCGLQDVDVSRLVIRKVSQSNSRAPLAGRCRSSDISQVLQVAKLEDINDQMSKGQYHPENTMRRGLVVKWDVRCGKRNSGERKESQGIGKRRSFTDV